MARKPSRSVAAIPEFVPLHVARRLLLHGAGLVDEAGPSASVTGTATADEVRSLIDRLGFVQLDSICVVERAHHHVLWTRLQSYRPALLDELQRTGRIFEQWTHDASVIPGDWFPHWRRRFDRAAWGAWLSRQMGADGPKLLKQIRRRVEREGPLLARDFESNGKRAGAWWDWKPAKAGLEYLWRTGHLSIPYRVGFEKVYDLTERVLPKVHGAATPSEREHVDWACRTALDRLGVATARELAAFWNSVTAAQAHAWCLRNLHAGLIVTVTLEGERPKAKPVFAWKDWKQRAAAICEPSSRMRLLSPFDPLVRDRSRCAHRFGFEYRFEAFVPAAKRKYGYYVLPILQGDRLVGRLDPKFDRGTGVLRLKRLCWEPCVARTRARRAAIESAAAEYAGFHGAERFEFEP